MPRETDLLRVKLVAHTLLDVQIQETALSPVIVSHPFTNSGISALRNEDGSPSMVDLINNSDDCTRWRRKVGEQIDSAENVHQIFVLLNPPYYLTFIKFAASDLSEKDLGQLLSIAWTQEECPNQDCNVSKRELVALFRSVSPEFLMDEEERTPGAGGYSDGLSGRYPLQRQKYQGAVLDTGSENGGQVRPPLR